MQLTLNNRGFRSFFCFLLLFNGMCSVYGMRLFRGYNVGNGNCLAIRNYNPNKSLIIDCGMEPQGSRQLTVPNDIQVADSLAQFVFGPIITIYITHNETDHFSLVQPLCQTLGGFALLQNSPNPPHVFIAYHNTANRRMGGILANMLNGNICDIHLIPIDCNFNNRNVMLNPPAGVNAIVDALGDDFVVQVLVQNIKPVVAGRFSTNENSLTLPLVVSYPNGKILFTGDADSKTYAAFCSNTVQNDNLSPFLGNMLNNVSILVLPHHGSNNNGESVWLLHVLSHQFNNANISLVLSSATPDLDHFIDPYISRILQNIGNNHYRFSLYNIMNLHPFFDSQQLGDDHMFHIAGNLLFMNIPL